MNDHLIEIYFNNSKAAIAFMGNEVRLVDVSDESMYLELEPNRLHKAARHYNINSYDFLASVITDKRGVNEINRWGELIEYLDENLIKPDFSQL